MSLHQVYNRVIVASTLNLYDAVRGQNEMRRDSISLARGRQRYRPRNKLFERHHFQLWLTLSPLSSVCCNMQVESVNKNITGGSGRRIDYVAKSPNPGFACLCRHGMARILWERYECLHASRELVPGLESAE